MTLDVAEELGNDTNKTKTIDSESSIKDVFKIQHIEQTHIFSRNIHESFTYKSMFGSRPWIYAN